MLKNKISNFFTKNLFKNKLHIIEGRKLISSNSVIEDLTFIQFKNLEIINNLTNEDFRNLMTEGFLTSSEKVLLLDILNLFNSIEVNFNRILGLNSNSCAGISAILNPNNNNPFYNNLFQTDTTLEFKKTLQGYIEIRHLIAHGLAKKHKDTNSILFFTSNRNDWNKKLKKRREDPEKFSNRPDQNILLKEMSDKSIIYAVAYVEFLEYLRSSLLPIEKYFSEKAAIETR
ncbi:hypothetical protein RFI36_10270 [Acinetobacter gerneri]|uniref:Cthe-2314-like HEPN domain-containing protein n=1 Tax=Acinetobacter gerneri TaxID=202952 RepID=A0AAW8JJ30_9GAMM|nr:hypothetical protein [Acinetobacter gerneri]MDQ9010122.1 hypothetical protein [Acinetobacter gerneri]MDQ9014273.1 hypothetical protein [Acinetobacter gerneri]MDQ9025400.1 hypothetical protein [Acinetobacter gerneri]MDQ9052725.1 hypothetical protein [Acinetobacter gerneri]MDQ9060343.1 hypothetical protein [Acinetobacter gerneri]